MSQILKKVKKLEGVDKNILEIEYIQEPVLFGRNKLVTKKVYRSNLFWKFLENEEICFSFSSSLDAIVKVMKENEFIV